ncbi:SufE family protein [Citricoccus sp. GCM10030269]|uniref:SufE family protein n=1 Tax=Citricoccus sp. GCM10030269 TaxID=3273388 RepID=UPI0036168610
MTTTELPEKLNGIIEDFSSVPDPDRLELLLEFSEELPALPERYADHQDEMEQVVECQTPLFLAIELESPEKTTTPDGGGAGPDSLVRLFVSAPPEAPTSRGFASVLVQSLDGLTASEVLDVPEDISARLGLQKALTPLRLRGMSAMLGRIKRNISDQLAA